MKQEYIQDTKKMSDNNINITITGDTLTVKVNEKEQKHTIHHANKDNNRYPNLRYIIVEGIFDTDETNQENTKYYLVETEEQLKNSGIIGIWKDIQQWWIKCRNIIFYIDISDSKLYGAMQIESCIFCHYTNLFINQFESEEFSKYYVYSMATGTAGQITVYDNIFLQGASFSGSVFLYHAIFMNNYFLPINVTNTDKKIDFSNCIFKGGASFIILIFLVGQVLITLYLSVRYLFTVQKITIIFLLKIVIFKGLPILAQ